MHKRTTVYIVLVLTVLSCGPCITMGDYDSDVGMTNVANMTAYANTQAVGDQSAAAFEATRLAFVVEATLTAIAASPDEPTAEPTQSSPETGTVSGRICYPSEGVPEVTVYAQSTADNSWVSFDYPGGWGEYTFPGIPPGDYVFFAYVKDESISIAGGYTQAVICGLGAGCDDHSLIAVHIGAGETVEGVDICDWYGPEGSLPPRP
ncbi:MAG: hypothetical protein JXB30_08775 [Anaerolineae bacterium]|nr:hypothetical protein [Anaerolineae bacterium]